jgi:spore germination protein (amino acid permease)
MRKLSDGKIGVREFTAILLFATGIKATDTTPDLLIFKGENAAWIVALLATLICAVPLAITILVVSKRKQELTDAIYTLTGKWIGTLIIAMLTFVVICGCFINSRSYVDIINTMYLDKTPIPALYLLLMAATAFVAKRGLETIGRSAWLIIWPVLFSQVLLAWFVWDEVRWGALAPIAGAGFKSLITAGVNYYSVFTEPIVLACFYCHVRNNRSFTHGNWIGYGVSAVWIIFSFALYVAIFDYPAVRQLNYPYHQLARMAQAGTITHLESLFLGFWVIGTVIHFAIYLYFSAYFFAKLFRLNEFEPLILPIAGFILLAGLKPDSIITLNAYRDTFLRSSSVLFFALPVLLWALDFWKGRVKGN